MRGCSGGAEEKAWYRNFNHAMRVEELTLPRPGPAQLHQAGLAPALEMEEAGAGWCCAAACSTQNLISINCGRAGAGRGCRGRAGAAVDGGDVRLPRGCSSRVSAGPLLGPGPPRRASQGATSRQSASLFGPAETPHHWPGPRWHTVTQTLPGQ